VIAVGVREDQRSHVRELEAERLQMGLEASLERFAGAIARILAA